jgi:hypothetical protein
MKASSGLWIVAGVIACATAIGAYRWHAANTVLATEPRSTSEFFRTYDPGPVLRKYGTERQHSDGTGSGSGWRQATRTRELTAVIALASSQVAGLTAALRNDIDTKLRAQGRLLGWSEGSGEYAWEYGSGNTWGFFVLERIEPELSNNCAVPGTWRVHMRFIERWQK